MYIYLTSQGRTVRCPGAHHTLLHILTKCYFKVEDGDSTEHQADHIRDQK